MRTVEAKHLHTQQQPLPPHPCQTDGGKSSSFRTPCNYQNVLAEEFEVWQAVFYERMSSRKRNVRNRNSNTKTEAAAFRLRLLLLPLHVHSAMDQSAGGAVSRTTGAATSLSRHPRTPSASASAKDAAACAAPSLRSAGCVRV